MTELKTRTKKVNKLPRSLYLNCVHSEDCVACFQRRIAFFKATLSSYVSLYLTQCITCWRKFRIQNGTGLFSTKNNKRFLGKVMSLIFWDSNEIILIDYYSEIKYLNEVYYKSFLRRLYHNCDEPTCILISWD